MSAGQTPAVDGVAEALEAALSAALPFLKTMEAMEDCPYPQVLRRRIALAEDALALARGASK